MREIDYKTYKKPSDYAKFEQGDNIIRVISKGYLGLQHGLRGTRGWVNLGLCTEDDTCEHCKKGNQAKRFWKWVVVDRKENEVKLLDAGIMIGDAICQMSNPEKDGDPTKYDIVINRVGEKLKTQYTVKRSRADIPITKADISRWQGMKRYIVNKYLGEK